MGKIGGRKQIICPYQRKKVGKHGNDDLATEPSQLDFMIDHA